MSFGTAVLVLLVSAGLAAVAPKAGDRGRLFSLLAVAGGLLTPWLGPPDRPLERFVLAIFGVALCARVVDLARDGRRWPMPFRFCLLVAGIDIREAEPEPRRLAPEALVAAFGHAALGGLGLLTAFAIAPRCGGAVFWLVRWLGGVLLVYGAAGAVDGSIRAVVAGLGYRIPTLHRAPVLAKSVAAFWSRHWNIVVSRWLAQHVHRPLVAAGYPAWGLAAAFGASTLLHVWLTLVALNLSMALVMGSFFMVQGGFVLLERQWDLDRWWTGPSRRVFTIALMLGTSPLFVEPFLRIVEG